MNLNKSSRVHNTNLVIRYSHSIHQKLDVLDYFFYPHEKQNRKTYSRRTNLRGQWWTSTLKVIKADQQNLLKQMNNPKISIFHCFTVETHLALKYKEHDWTHGTIWNSLKFITYLLNTERWRCHCWTITLEGWKMWAAAQNKSAYGKKENQKDTPISLFSTIRSN